MKRNPPKRCAIIGLPGSGKSTFAMRLGNVLNIPVHHLDKHMFDKGQKRDLQEFLSTKEALVNTDSWIIEGCSISTLEMRFARADTVIYFHFPRLLCIWRLWKRMFSFDQSLAATGCSRKIHWRLIKYIWNFDREKRSGVEELQKRYPHVDFLIFRRPKDADKYLENMT